MLDFATVKAAASGRWPEIFTYLGIPSISLTGRHCPCPSCGGHDRFRFLPTNSDGNFFCGGGGNLTGGDGFNLLVHIGFSRADALHAVSQYLGLDRVMLSNEQRQEIQKRKRQAHHNDLDDGIFHECHILMQTTADRKNNCDFENNRKFREAQPDWQPYPKDIWDRELIAAKRIIKMLEARYDV